MIAVNLGDLLDRDYHFFNDDVCY